MKSYHVDFRIEIAGTLEIMASTADEAREHYYEMTYQDIIDTSPYINEEVDVDEENNE